jgi:hypothetical protein
MQSAFGIKQGGALAERGNLLARSHARCFLNFASKLNHAV